jgi:hypothetical protein
MSLSSQFPLKLHLQFRSPLHLADHLMFDEVALIDLQLKFVVVLRLQLPLNLIHRTSQLVQCGVQNLELDTLNLAELLHHIRREYAHLLTP